MGDWLLKKPTRLLWLALAFDVLVSASLLSMGVIPFATIAAALLVLWILWLIPRLDGPSGLRADSRDATDRDPS